MVNFFVLVENTVDFIMTLLLLEFSDPLVTGWLVMFCGITTWFRVVIFSARRGSTTYFPRAIGKLVGLVGWRPFGVWLGVTLVPRSGERRYRFKLLGDKIF